MAAGFILIIISLSGFIVWIIGMKKLFVGKKLKAKKEIIDESYVESYSDITRFSKTFIKNKGIRYSVEHKEGMTYTEIENGIKKRDPGTITFLQIFIGFYFFIIGLISSIGSFTVSSGNSDGWFMIGFCIFFTSIFLYIIISQKININKKTFDK